MQSAAKLTITLPPEMASSIRQKLESGLWVSNSKMTREALRGLMEWERRLQRLDGPISPGLGDRQGRSARNSPLHRPPQIPTDHQPRRRAAGSLAGSDPHSQVLYPTALRLLDSTWKRLDQGGNFLGAFS